MGNRDYLVRLNTQMPPLNLRSSIKPTKSDSYVQPSMNNKMAKPAEVERCENGN